MASSALTYPPLTLAPDSEDLLRILHELLSDGQDPCYEDLAREMGITVAVVQVHVGILVAGGWIAVPADSRLPIRVLRPPEMPDFDLELSLGDWELGQTDWQIEGEGQ